MIYVVLGQTASGKTSLVTSLARKLKLPLINADAFQIYEDFNIASAKPSPLELENVEYNFISNISPLKPFSIKNYQQEVRNLIDKYTLQGRDIIISGGSFLYVKAALFSYNLENEEIDVEKIKELEDKTLEELVEILKKEDIDTYNNIDLKNKRRVVRAVYMSLIGHKKSSLISNEKPKLLYPCKFFNIDIETSILNERINQRVEEMFNLGIVKEVDSLLQKYPSDIQAFKGIGYRQFIEGYKENKTIEQIKEDIKIATRQYAKRQRTFLRHQFANLNTLKADEIEKYITYDVNRRIRNKASIEKNVLPLLENMKILVVGLGGVGSILVQGLVRLGVFKVRIIDKDVVDISNLNRQISYDLSDIGEKKAISLKKHLLKLDPLLEIETIDDFYKDEYIDSSIDFVFDCIDDVKAKCNLIQNCLAKNIPFICATGSGLRKKANMFYYGKLSDTSEPLAKAIKKELKNRNFFDFDKINVTYSKEIPQKRITSYIGSNVISPNSQGLFLLSSLLEFIEFKK